MSFADLTASLDGTVLDHLGDAVTFIAPNGAETSVRAFVDATVDIENFGAARTQAADYGIAFLKADYPQIIRDTQVRIPNHDRVFYMVDLEVDESGLWWVASLVRTPGGR